MAEEWNHVILTAEGDYGYSAMSPQLPGFALMRGTQTELRQDLYEVLDAVGLLYPREMHNQIRGVTPDGREFLIRTSQRTHVAERQDVRDRLLNLLAEDVNPWRDAQVSDVTGVLTFICAVDSDSMDWVSDQTRNNREIAILAEASGTSGVITRQLVSEDLAEDFEKPTMHLPPDVISVGQMIATAPTKDYGEHLPALVLTGADVAS